MGRTGAGPAGGRHRPVDRRRRWFLQTMTGLGLCLAGPPLLAGCGSRVPGRGPAAGEAPPETTAIRLGDAPAACVAPYYVAEQLLHGEGFADVQYVTMEREVDGFRALATGETHFDIQVAVSAVKQLDAGDPIVALAGLHVGCFELFGTERVRAVRDLAGKSVAVTDLGSGRHLLLASMATYVGLDPSKDIRFVTDSPDEAIRLLDQRRVDALMAFPPEPQELRARGIGQVVVSTGKDRPWSQNFCCMIVANRQFVRRHPAATKRVLRAVLKANDLCAGEPEAAARLLVDRVSGTSYDYALQTVRELRYDRWREYDPEDTLRFYALRLREAGMVKSTPNALIEKGADWRFLNELKRELKA